MLFGQLVHDAPYAGPKAHIKHTVGLVQHQDLDGVQAHMAMLDKVKQAARRGDQQVASALELLDLLVKARSAHDDHGPLAGLLAYNLDHLVDLRRQLAGGRDNQGVRAFSGGSGNALQAGQGKRGRLARAGLRAGNDVFALKHVGDGARLHRGGLGKTKGIDTFKDLLV